MARGKNKISYANDHGLTKEIRRVLQESYEKNGFTYTGGSMLSLHHFGGINYTLESERNPHAIGVGNMVKLTIAGYKDIIGYCHNVNPDNNTFLFMGSHVVEDKLAVVLLQLITGNHINLFYCQDNHLKHINSIKIKA